MVMTVCCSVSQTVQRAVDPNWLEIYKTVLLRLHANNFRKRFHGVTGKAAHM